MRTRIGRMVLVGTVMLGLLPLWDSGEAFGQGGELTLTVVDEATGQPIPYRLHLTNQAKRPRKLPRLPFWMDHSTVPGSVAMALPRGNYLFEIECGPEYPYRFGHFTINPNAKDQKQVTMPRIADLATLGWYGGDLDLHRPERETPLVMAAEQLRLAPLVTYPINTPGEAPPGERVQTTEFGGRIGTFNTQTLPEHGGILTLINHGQRWHLPKDASRADVLDLLMEARRDGQGWIDLSKPSWEDTPLWLGLGIVRSVGIAPRDFGRDGLTFRRAPEGRPRDENRWGGVHGYGRWLQHLYFQMLEAGLQLPPTAGSGSGVVANPAGYNRVYAHLDGEFTYEKWWSSVARGQTIVTNGPLLLPQVNGQPPGATFSAGPGDPFVVNFQLTLHTRDQIDYFEVIRDGEVVHMLRLDEFAQQGGRIPPLEFTESGWFLLRAVCAEPKTYRYVTSAPFYVHVDSKARISRKAVQFFQDWLEERAEALLAEAANDDERRRLTEHLDQARRFWQQRADAATVD